MAKLVSALRHHPLESGGSSRQFGGRILSLKWGAIALLVLLAIIIAVAINALQHQVAAKQDATTSSAPIPHKTEAISAPAPSSPTSDANIQSSQSVHTQVTNNGSHTSTNVTVNGKQVPVPTNGTVHKEVTDDNGNKAEVNISSSSSQSESSVDSSISVNVSSDQSTVDNSE
jgi:cytoskeletal protein RodZ